MSKIIVMLVISLNLMAINLNTGIIPTKKDCINYKDQFERFMTAFDKNTVPAWKKVSIHMLKATQDDLIMYCGKYIEITPYKNSQYVIDQEYFKYWGNTK